MRGPPPRGDLPEVPPDLAHWLAMVMAAAQRLSSIGSGARAVALLRNAAGRVWVKHVAAGLHALADLHEAHPPRRQLRRASQ